MPTYSIKGPGGKTYSIEGPEGATRDQVVSAIQRRLAAQQSAQPEFKPEAPRERLDLTPAPPETSLLGYIPETAKAIGRGAAGLLESSAFGTAFALPEEAEQAARGAVTETGRAVQESSLLAPGKAYEDNTFISLMEGLGSTLPFLAAGLSGPLGWAAGLGLGVSAGRVKQANAPNERGLRKKK